MSDVTPLLGGEGRQPLLQVQSGVHDVCTAGVTGCCQAQPSTAQFLLHLSLLEKLI